MSELDLKLALLEFCEAVAGVEGVKPSNIMTDADITLRIRRATDRARSERGSFYQSVLTPEERSAAGHAGGGHGE